MPGFVEEVRESPWPKNRARSSRPKRELEVTEGNGRGAVMNNPLKSPAARGLEAGLQSRRREHGPTPIGRFSGLATHRWGPASATSPFDSFEDRISNLHCSGLARIRTNEAIVQRTVKSRAGPKPRAGRRRSRGGSRPAAQFWSSGRRSGATRGSGILPWPHAATRGTAGIRSGRRQPNWCSPRPPRS